jgi:hypothetical protein
VAYVRTVTTASGAVAVQIVHSNRRGSREIEHIGSAHSPGDVEVLKTIARQRLHANQDPLDFDVRAGSVRQRGADPVQPGPAPVGHAGHGLPGAGAGPGLCRRGVRQLVLARVIEPPASSTRSGC